MANYIDFSGFDSTTVLSPISPLGGFDKLSPTSPDGKTPLISITSVNTRPQHSPFLRVELIRWQPHDGEHPFEWSFARKLTLTLVAMLSTLLVSLNGTSITVAAPQMNEAFGISDETFPRSFWAVTVWALGGAVSALLLLPLMEDLGVRTPYLITYACFVLSVGMQCLAQSYAIFLVVRFISGACASVCANVISSIICNVWQGDRGRAKPMTAYVVLYLIGLTAGPVLGAVILQNLQWRWILYIQAIIYTACFPIYYLLLRESREDVILEERARRLRARGIPAVTEEFMSGGSIVCMWRPIHMLCTESITFWCSLWSGFSVGLVYLFTQSAIQVFHAAYDFDDIQVGYLQAALVVGELLGWALSPIQEKLYFNSASFNRENPGQPVPEARLYMSIPGSIIGVAGGMFIYAWTSVASAPMHWICPAIGLMLVGAGICLVVCAITDYMTDAYSKYGGSAVAALAFAESVTTGVLPLVTRYMYDGMGYAWASSTIGFIGLVMGVVPIVFLVYGSRIRARSPFMKDAIYL